MKKIKKICSVILTLALLSTLLYACGEDTDSVSQSELSAPVTPSVGGDFPQNRRTAADRLGKNNTDPFVIAINQLQGDFNPFYSFTQGDKDVVGLTQLPLLAYGEDMFPVAGVDFACAAYSYSVKENEGGTTFEFVIKNGLYYSDGIKPLSGRDVVFSMYVLADPLYDGGSPFALLDIAGLEAYRTQIADQTEREQFFAECVQNALTLLERIKKGDAGGFDEEGNALPPINAAEASLFNEKLREAVIARGELLVKNALTPADIQKDASEDFSERFPCALILMELGALTYNSATGEYRLSPDTGLTLDSLHELDEHKINEAAWMFVSQTMDAWSFDALCAQNTVTSGESSLIGSALINYYKQKYILDNKGSVPTISGISLDKISCEDGIERERVCVTINGAAVGDIFALAELPVASVAYYSTEALFAQCDGKSGFGVNFADASFFEQLKEKNVPFGAGAYVPSDGTGGVTSLYSKFYVDGQVNLVANDSFLLGVPYMRIVRFKTIAAGKELDALKNGDVHFAAVSPTAASINSVAGTSISYTTAPSSGYNYIGFNASLLDENELYAMRTLIDTSFALSAFPPAFVFVPDSLSAPGQWTELERDPKQGENEGLFDQTGEEAKKAFLLSAKNTTNDEGKIVRADGSEIEYTFFFYGTGEHPIKLIFDRAAEILSELGISVEIVFSSEGNGAQSEQSSLNGENSYALWASYQRYELLPDLYTLFFTAEKEVQPDEEENGENPPEQLESDPFGLSFLLEHGTSTQRTRVRALNSALEKTRSAHSVSELYSAYSEAFDILSELSLMLPAYCRVSMYAYDSIALDAASFNARAGAFLSPISELWNISLIP